MSGGLIALIVFNACLLLAVVYSWVNDYWHVDPGPLEPAQDGNMFGPLTHIDDIPTFTGDSFIHNGVEYGMINNYTVRWDPTLEVSPGMIGSTPVQPPDDGPTLPLPMTGQPRSRNVELD